jgi:uridine phosphorylase
VHVADVEHILSSAGYQASEWTTISTGTTDPNVLYVVRPKKGGSFIVNRGLPGAGGIATQTAELGALGVRKVVHIGTSCLLGRGMADSNLVVSLGSFKDGATVLLSDYVGRRVAPIAKPDPNLVGAIESVLMRHHIAFQESLGYTIPVFYFQPSGLMNALLATNQCANLARPAYLEMEQASFFQTCHRMHMQSASIVVGSDRYVLTNRELKHEWLGDTDAAVTRAFKTALEAMDATQ